MCICFSDPYESPIPIGRVVPASPIVVTRKPQWYNRIWPGIRPGNARPVMMHPIPRQPVPSNRPVIVTQPVKVGNELPPYIRPNPMIPRQIPGLSGSRVVCGTRKGF